MVIDSSALIAIISKEPERAPFEQCVKLATNRLIGAATLVETSLVVLSRRREEGIAILRELLVDMRVETVPLSADHARLAVDAFRRFGKGRHPAGLNLGDCFSYALAKATGEPLLFKGDDFARTDVKRAV
ncbi:MAG TPA: type II toxin-antitoxin system VapC family toxin [Caulobacteraceae bacterium]|jgi:ribonuclease VapC|nr:type II toxin-antitoxin system VapC family toxin [Caulobacteraceae bacterium]